MNQKLVQYFYTRLKNGESLSDIDKDIDAAIVEARKRHADEGHKEEEAAKIIDAYNAYCGKYAPDLQVKVDPKQLVELIEKNKIGLQETMNIMSNLDTTVKKISDNLDKKIAGSKSLFDLIK